MNVRRAQELVKEISQVCVLLGEFDTKNPELSDSYDICEARNFLADYRKLLETAIESAELKLEWGK